jgi:hypothetical protein
MNTYSTTPLTISQQDSKDLLWLARNEGGLYVPYLATKFNSSIKSVCEYLIHEYPECCIVDNMVYLTQPNKLWFYEVCDTKYMRGEYLRADLLSSFTKQNKKEDQHISVFAKDQSWVNQIKETGSIKKAANSQVKAESIWIELDRKFEGGYDQAFAEAWRFYRKFEYKDHIRLWTSGNNSVHIEVDGKLFGSPQGQAHLLCGIDRWVYRLGTRLFGQQRHTSLGYVDPWVDDTDKVQEAYRTLGRTIHPKYKQELENVDPNIYHFNSLIRAPWSIHETGKGTKCILHGPDKFPDIPPYLMWIYIEESLRPRKKKKHVDCGADSSYIIQEFNDIEGFDPDDADSEGWVQKLHNAFYDDQRPSLSVNINTGLFWDFGDPDYQFGFVEYLMNKYSITKEQAESMIHDNAG